MSRLVLGSIDIRLTWPQSLDGMPAVAPLDLPTDWPTDRSMLWQRASWKGRTLVRGWRQSIYFRDVFFMKFLGQIDLSVEGFKCNSLVSKCSTSGNSKGRMRRGKCRERENTTSDLRAWVLEVLYRLWKYEGHVGSLPSITLLVLNKYLLLALLMRIVRGKM